MLQEKLPANRIDNSALSETDTHKLGTGKPSEKFQEDMVQGVSLYSNTAFLLSVEMGGYVISIMLLHQNIDIPRYSFL